MAKLSELSKSLNRVISDVSAGSNSVSNRQMGRMISDYFTADSQTRTLPVERLRSMEAVADLLYDLTVPERTPRVPKQLRSRARAILKHYPNEEQLDRIAQGAPELLNRIEDSLYTAVKGYTNRGDQG